MPVKHHIGSHSTKLKGRKKPVSISIPKPSLGRHRKQSKKLKVTQQQPTPQNTVKASPKKLRFGRFLTAIGIALLLIILTALGFWRILPGMILSDQDKAFLIVNTSSEREGETNTTWLAIIRGSNREGLLMPLQLEPSSKLIQGINPELPVIDWQHRLALALNADALDTTANASIATDSAEIIASQGLGIAITKVLILSQETASPGQLRSALFARVLREVRMLQRHSPAYELFVGFDNLRILQQSIASEFLPEVLDRNDVSLMGDPDECAIAVLNDTTRNGFAGRYGQLFEQSGAEVVRVDGTGAFSLFADDSELQMQATRVYVSQSHVEGCKKALEVIRELFPNAPTIQNTQFAARLRSDVVLTLGMDSLQSPLLQESN